MRSTRGTKGRALALALAAALGGGCGRAEPPAPPPGLLYRLPTPPLASYRMADTVAVEIQALEQSFSVEGGARSDWRMDFAPDSGGVRVTATLLDLDATMSNPLGAPQRVDEGGVAGPVVFVLDPRGDPAIRVLPELDPAVAQFFSGATIAEGFFPRLPGRLPLPGESWAEVTTEEGGEANRRARTEWTYTLAGDSAVGTASYLLVRASGVTEQASGGSLSGTEFTQTVAGTVTGHFLWDPVAGILHSSEYRSDLSGTAEVSLAPVPLAVRVRSVVRIGPLPPS